MFHLGFLIKIGPRRSVLILNICLFERNDFFVIDIVVSFLSEFQPRSFVIFPDYLYSLKMLVEIISQVFGGQDF